MARRIKLYDRMMYCLAFLLLLTAGGNARADSLPVRVDVASSPGHSYYLQLPAHFNAQKTYWIYVFVGGTGCMTADYAANTLHNLCLPIVSETHLEAIMVYPLLDDRLYQSPLQGDGELLLKMLAQIRKQYHVYPKILLQGFSGGAQFAHRFAFWYPAEVLACAVHACGSWTTPDGTLIDKDDANQLTVTPADPQYDGNLWTRKAAKESMSVKFMVSCGMDDSRYPLATLFAQKLNDAKYSCKTLWIKLMKHEFDRRVGVPTIQFLAKAAAIALKQ